MTRRGLLLVLSLCLLLPTLPAEAARAAVGSPGRPFAERGTWVSIFARATVWDHPERHVRRMHRHGVHTLYLQTASSTTPVGTDLFRRDRLARFLHAAHARGMRVVAWYLPPLRHVAREHARAMAAIDFRTTRGQRFDAFGLDIEPSTTTPGVRLRNENLRRLSRRLRDSVGDRYRLGAIFPSPMGMAISTEYWPRFPYDVVGQFYDVAVPMSYSTYRAKGAAATYAYTMDNIAFLRDRLGDVALHMIGGAASRLDASEADAFVAACNDARVTGASIYHYGGYGPEDWAALSRIAL